MPIQINDDYRVKVGAGNLELQRRDVIRKSKDSSKIGQETWKRLGYFADYQSLLVAMARYHIGGAQCFMDWCNRIIDMERLIRGLNIRKFEEGSSRDG